MTKGIRLLDKNTILVYTGKFSQLRAFERYIPLKRISVAIMSALGRLRSLMIAHSGYHFA